MPRSSSFTLTDEATLDLFFIQRYRFLTIDQFAQATEINRSTASDQLRIMERHGLLGHFTVTEKFLALKRGGFQRIITAPVRQTTAPSDRASAIRSPTARPAM
jgi:hypothetical protein